MSSFLPILQNPLVESFICKRRVPKMTFYLLHHHATNMFLIECPAFCYLSPRKSPSQTTKSFFLLGDPPHSPSPKILANYLHLTPYPHSNQKTCLRLSLKKDTLMFIFLIWAPFFSRLWDLYPITYQNNLYKKLKKKKTQKKDPPWPASQQQVSPARKTPGSTHPISSLLTKC